MDEKEIKNPKDIPVYSYSFLYARGNGEEKQFRESKEALGLESAFHIRVEDWLFYLTHSDFVMTDDYYGMCMAILFEKDFAVLLKRDDPDAERYVMLLEQLGLTERLVYEEDDFLLLARDYDLILADGTMAPMLEGFSGEFLELPHFAVSGKQVVV